MYVPSVSSGCFNNRLGCSTCCNVPHLTQPPIAVCWGVVHARGGAEGWSTARRRVGEREEDGGRGACGPRFVVEPPNLIPHRSARLLLDTKHSRENTKLLGSVGHTPRENPKIHIFAIRITNEIIKLTSFWTISYITFNTTSEYNNY